MVARLPVKKMVGGSNPPGGANGILEIISIYGIYFKNHCFICWTI